MTNTPTIPPPILRSDAWGYAFETNPLVTGIRRRSPAAADAGPLSRPTRAGRAVAAWENEGGRILETKEPASWRT